MPATKETFVTPDAVEMFLAKMVKDGHTTTDAVAELMGATHLTISRLRKRGGDQIMALAMAAILKGLKPFDGSTLAKEELPEVSKAKGGHALVKAPPKPRESATERKARMERELRAEIEAELRKKYKLPAAETEAA